MEIEKVSTNPEGKIFGKSVLEVLYTGGSVGLVRFTDTDGVTEFWGYKKWNALEDKFVYRTNRNAKTAGQILDIFLEERGIEL